MEIKSYKNMITIFQFALLGLVLFSILLVVGIPVLLTSPESWDKNKDNIFKISALWIGFVFTVGVLNYLVI